MCTARAETILAGGYFLPNSLCLTVRKYTSILIYPVPNTFHYIGMQLRCAATTINHTVESQRGGVLLYKNPQHLATLKKFNGHFSF